MSSGITDRGSRKSVRKMDSKIRLYDLVQDPLETTNLWEENEELTEIGNRIKKQKDIITERGSQHHGAKQKSGGRVGCIGSKGKGKPTLRQIKDPKAKSVTWPC